MNIREETKEGAASEQAIASRTGVTIASVLAEVKRRAIRARDDAGRAGHHHDGGCSATLDQLEAYRAGQKGELPCQWFGVRAEMIVDAAREQSEYARLKLKFEGAQP